MAQDLRPDICVIGAGPGGLATATAAAAFGVPVVLIEPVRNGGDGSGRGVAANPPLGAAVPADLIRSTIRSTLMTARPGSDFGAVGRRVRAVADTIAPNSSRERLAGLGVTVIEGEARFSDGVTVTVGGQTIKARRFVIATGASPALPAVPGLAETPHSTEDTVGDLTDCPRHLLVIGAGAGGLELAQAFRRFGAEVTVLDSGPPLAGEDAECTAILLDALERDGIRLYCGIEIARVRRILARLEIDIVTAVGPETIAGTHLLVAAGRRPRLASLDLDAAGIRYGDGGIAVDKRLRTTNKGVYAIGEAAAGPRSAGLAQHHAELVVRHALFRQRVNLHHHAVPSVIHTDPELAQVGYLEDEARAYAGAIRVLRAPYRDNHRALAEQATRGHIKVVTDRNGTILGATLVGAGAGEAIAAWTLAISRKLNIGALAGLIVPYPSYAEVGKRAAMTYFMRGLTSSQVRRIIGWLRRLG
jgi:pyruvate/2-oxoglutarate dehydrogenase complex dihydrolipoamide dehydrogenase (E3) component